MNATSDIDRTETFLICMGVPKDSCQWRLLAQIIERMREREICAVAGNERIKVFGEAVSGIDAACCIIDDLTFDSTEVDRKFKEFMTCDETMAVIDKISMPTMRCVNQHVQSDVVGDFVVRGGCVVKVWNPWHSIWEYWQPKPDTKCQPIGRRKPWPVRAGCPPMNRGRHWDRKKEF